jgi:Protein of unknown function (DUF3500)
MPNSRTFRSLTERSIECAGALNPSWQTAVTLYDGLGPGEDGKTIPPQGIKGSALTAGQQAMLLEVIGAWVNIVQPEAAKGRMAAIKDKIAETYFAWSGPTDKGGAAYFRVQGPAVVIEYAPQRGTDHIHTVIRDPKDDYGARLLRR